VVAQVSCNRDIIISNCETLFCNFWSYNIFAGTQYADNRTGGTTDPNGNMFLKSQGSSPNTYSRTDEKTFFTCTVSDKNIYPYQMFKSSISHIL